MPVLLQDIMPIDLLEKHIEDGVVRKQVHPDYPDTLFILNYSEQAQFGRIWDQVTNKCRGLIVAGSCYCDAVVVARPFNKFHNINTTYVPETMEENLPKDVPPTVTQKLDGSMGVLYKWDHQTWVATRGSFQSEQARWATAWMRAHEAKHGYSVWLDEYTPVFEIIYADNRIVVDYDFEGLVLLSLINKATGREMDRALVESMATFNRINVVKLFDKSLSECAAENTLNEEGYVLTYKNGVKVKVKFADYVRLHRVLTGLNPKGIWELLAKNQVESVELILKDDKMPEAFKTWFSGWVGHLRETFRKLEEESQAVFAGRPVEGTRKDNALYFQKTPHLCSMLFAMLDGKQYADIIWDRLKPRADEKTFKKDGE
ncbi:MAG: T4 RnlA family RNA ligase [Acidobacteriia bacterium]|nr:T4 RnlA family RNA ligase [Terriglobia bacterium]